MSLPRKLGGRVLECFSGEWRDSSESVMTPGKGWCLCACQENWFKQRRKEEWVTQGSLCLAVGGCTSMKLVFAPFTPSVADVPFLGLGNGKKSNV